MTKPLAFFRVYSPNNPSLYFKVYVWKTHKQLLRARKRTGATKENIKCLAFTFLPYKKSHLIGEIHFYKDRIGAGTIAHEITHATIGLLRRLDYNFGKLSIEETNDNEELFAMTMDELTRVIVNKLYTYKFFNESK